jgi:RHS repeat-associated protein
VATQAGTTAYRLDPWGRVTGVTNALGETSARTLSGAGRVQKEQGASGGNFVYSYDSLGRITGAGKENDAAVQVKYNADGTVAEKTDRNGEKTLYTYNGFGQLAKESTALGETEYRYDGAGRVVYREIRNTDTAGAEKYFTSWTYDDGARTVTVTAGGLYTETWHINAWEEATQRVDGEGNERSWKYDGAGKLAASIDGYGRETRYTWNAIGKVEKIAYPDESEVHYEYNYLGLVTKITDGEGTRWQGGYDETGRLVWEKGRPGIDKAYKYDALGRVTEVKTGGDVTERYSYGSRGRTVTFTDGAGNAFTQEKNEYAEIAGETDRLGDRQTYEYDSEGRLITKTAYSGKRVTTERRDSTGTVTTSYADGSQSVILRDNGGNITSATGASGTLRYRYDAGGKLVMQQDERAGETTEYAYNKAGQRTRMGSGNRGVHYYSGKNGELAEVIDYLQHLEVKYEYDAMGRETRRVYRNGVKQETFYDKAGRVTMIRETNPSRDLLRAEGYLYDEQGRRSYSVDELGNVTVYQYDNQSRLAIVLTPWTEEKSAADKQEAAEAGLFFSNEKGSPERYSVQLGDLARMRELLNRYAYDRGPLVAYNQILWRETYTYDVNGNRASKTTPWGKITYAYDEENRLVKKGYIVYAYDKDGNLLTEKGDYREARYEYNGQNRMAYSETRNKEKNTIAVSKYTYDAYGRRTIAQDEGRAAMRTLYDGFTFEVIRESEAFNSGNFTVSGVQQAVIPSTSTTDSNKLSRHRLVTEGYSTWLGDSAPQPQTGQRATEPMPEYRYAGINVTLYANGEAVAINRYSTRDFTGGTAYLGKDILGSVRGVSNEWGQLEERYEYDAFGKPYKGDLDSGMNLGYTGKPYDTATGMYNYGYRDYVPEVARFTTVDPIRDGRNWFAYVNNDPVNYVDLWGLEWVRSGTFGEDYSNVPTATVDQHLGEDWVYMNDNREDATIGQPVPSLTTGTATVGNSAANGNFVRVTTPDGQRTDYFHLDSTAVTDGAQVQTGDILGNAGNTGGVTAHLHVAQSYPEGNAPQGSGTVINEFGRSYVDPPDVQNPAPATPVTQNDQVGNTDQQNRKNH